MNEDSFIAEKAPVDWYAMRHNSGKTTLARGVRHFQTTSRHASPCATYLKSEVLQGTGTLKGEWLRNRQILCCLIEFLESTAQGSNYRYFKTR